jgi:hypothetical protein
LKIKYLAGSYFYELVLPVPKKKDFEGGPNAISWIQKLPDDRNFVDY